MAYAECEAGMQSILQALTAHFATPAQVAVKDYTIEDAGTLTWVVLTPGAVGYGEKISGGRERAWGIVLELFYAWRGDLNTTLTAFETVRADVISAIDNNPNLVIQGATSGVNGVGNTTVESDSDPIPYKPRQDNTMHSIGQKFRVTVYQTTRPT